MSLRRSQRIRRSRLRGTISGQRGASPLLLTVLIGLFLTAGAGFGGWIVASQSAAEQLAEQEDEIKRLKKRLGAQPSPEPLASAAPQTQEGDAPAAQTATYSSANLGFAVDVPEEWIGKWRYQEASNVGVSTNSVTFFLINKETKYAEVATIGKIPIDKYNDARASGHAIGNPDSLLEETGGFAYVVVFADGTVGDYKDFTYAEATAAAKRSFKDSFRTL
ncbi:MAG: hypothetical protein WD846_03895 [Patescibacteria group bacterium]